MSNDDASTCGPYDEVTVTAPLIVSMAAATNGPRSCAPLLRNHATAGSYRAPLPMTALSTVVPLPLPTCQ